MVVVYLQIHWLNMDAHYMTNYAENTIKYLNRISCLSIPARLYRRKIVSLPWFNKALHLDLNICISAFLNKREVQEHVSLNECLKHHLKAHVIESA